MNENESTKRLPLTSQQIYLIQQSQQALTLAQTQANAVLVGVIAAAGIEKAKPMNVSFDESYLEIELT